MSHRAPAMLPALSALVGLALTGCPEPEPAPRERPDPVERAEAKPLPRPRPAAADTDADPAEAADDGAIEPDAVVVGVGGRRCEKWGDRLVITRPLPPSTADGVRELGQRTASQGLQVRIRPHEGDLDAACTWEGPVTASYTVTGEVFALIDDRLLTREPRTATDGVLTVHDVATGRVLTRLEGVVNPGRVDPDGTVAYAVAYRPEGRPAEGQPCEAWLSESWGAFQEGAREAGVLVGDPGPIVPRCEPRALEDCKVAFLFGRVLDLDTGESRPVSAPASCVAAEG